MTSETRTAVRFPLRTTRLSTVRDILMVGVCVAIVASFIVDLWASPAPQEFRAFDGRSHARQMA